MTKEELKIAEDALDNAASLQSLFWEALSELEDALGGIEVDDSQDLNDATVETLLEAGEEQ